MWQVLLQKVTTHSANQRNMDIGFRLMILHLEVGHGLHKDQNQDGKKHSIILNHTIQLFDKVKEIKLCPTIESSS